MFSALNWVVLLSVITDIAQSTHVYVPELQRNVSQHKYVATWEEARQHCESEGAMLASPVNADLLNYMKSIITVNDHTTPYFIGFKARRNVELQFVSEEGVVLEDVPDLINMVEKIEPRDGDCLCMDGRSIRAVQCWTRLPYLCYSNETSTNGTSLEATTTDVPTSPDNFITTTEYRLLRTGSYYKFHSTPANWLDAKSTCQSEDGYLAIIDDYNEREALMYAVDSRLPFIWIGLQRDSEEPQIWLDIHGIPLNAELYDLFIPETRFRIEDTCGSMIKYGHLDDRPCSDRLPFICEKQSAS